MNDGVKRASVSTRKLLLITLEPISKSMAGPAIRCIELARQLADEFDVTVFSPAKGDHEFELRQTDNFCVIAGGSKTALYDKASASDVLFVQANVLKAFSALERLDKYLVVDLYDPVSFHCWFNIRMSRQRHPRAIA